MGDLDLCQMLFLFFSALLVIDFSFLFRYWGHNKEKYENGSMVLFGEILLIFLVIVILLILYVRVLSLRHIQ